MEIINDDTYFTWTVDRTPDYNLYNLNNIDNQINEVNYRDLSSYNNSIIHNAIESYDDFISFDSIREILQINFRLNTITASSDNDLNCCVCMETKQNTQICQLNCSHKFCTNCITTLIVKNRNTSTCPLCRSVITNITVQTEEHLEILTNL